MEPHAVVLAHSHVPEGDLAAAREGNVVGVPVRPGSRPTGDRPEPVVLDEAEEGLRGADRARIGEEGDLPVAEVGLGADDRPARGLVVETWAVWELDPSDLPLERVQGLLREEADHAEGVVVPRLAAGVENDALRLLEEQQSGVKPMNSTAYRLPQVRTAATLSAEVQ